MENFFSKFRLHNEKEDHITVGQQIEKGVIFRGTNLWILIFAIFVASLGLNVNSTAVIIGAMLISPLMGPIMGLGFGMGINDIALLKKSLYNYFVATLVALVTSTCYFFLTPINEAHSEILARTSPNIYDVLIALFGGLAGMVAMCSNTKGNVIPGVAIATALMPPLCTAGYGIATLQFKFFFGAFYLYLINTVFIALATFAVVSYLHFPKKQLSNPKLQKIAARIVATITLLTIIPSIYFGYLLIEESKYEINANYFIEKEAVFTNDYLLKKIIDPKHRKITLIYGGREITEGEILNLKKKLAYYNLNNTELFIKQGFTYLTESETNNLSLTKNATTVANNNELMQLQYQIDSIYQSDALSKQIFKELREQNKNILSAIISPVKYYTDTTINNLFLVNINSNIDLEPEKKEILSNWLKVRLNKENLLIRFSNEIRKE